MKICYLWTKELHIYYYMKTAVQAEPVTAVFKNCYIKIANAILRGLVYLHSSNTVW